MSVVDRLNGAARKLPVWVLYVIGGLWPVWLLYLADAGSLGVEPINALERELGELALKMLVIGLAITPLRAIIGVNLIRFRRAIGVLTFYFVAAHLLVWLVLDVQILSQIWQDILKRPYITVGMGAFVILLPLAVTSNNWSVRRLGAKWRKLHKLVYPAAVLGAVHFVMIGKTWQTEPLVYLALIVGLLLWRWGAALKKKRQRGATAQSGTRVA